jgi:hypothetical protein
MEDSSKRRGTNEMGGKCSRADLIYELILALSGEAGSDDKNAFVLRVNGVSH